MDTRHLPAAVVFDLDGTLVDTGPDLTAALNHCLSLVGRPPVALRTVRDMIGLGARKLLDLGLSHTGDSTPEQVEALYPAFIDYYAANVCLYSQTYPGVVAFLEKLKAANIVLGICTNKPVAMSVALIKTLQLDHYFDVNLGADSLAVRKPDPLHLLTTIDRLGVSADQTVMLGDSMVDVNTAKAAHVPIVAVSFGFSHIPATAFGAEAVIDHYNDALDAVTRVHSKRR